MSLDLEIMRDCGYTALVVVVVVVVQKGELSAPTTRASCRTKRRAHCCWKKTNGGDNASNNCLRRRPQVKQDETSNCNRTLPRMNCISVLNFWMRIPIMLSSFSCQTEILVRSPQEILARYHQRHIRLKFDLNRIIQCLEFESGRWKIIIF